MALLSGPEYVTHETAVFYSVATLATVPQRPLSALNLSQLSFKVLKTNPAMSRTSVLASWGSC